MSEAKAFQIHAGDTVATLIDDLETAGEVAVLGGFECDRVTAREAIQAGHKVALVEIPEGEAVIKFGVTIGRASRRIEPGEWVHLHNIESQHDERSGSLDQETGVATDTEYR